VTTQPTPLDRQVAEEHARHPTSRDATRAGARFGLFIGAVSLAIDVVSRIVPTDLTHSLARSWQSELIGGILGLGVGVLCCVVMAQLAAAVIRWRRRAAAPFWYPDRAA
jgi:hypothetical protein